MQAKYSSRVWLAIPTASQFLPVHRIRSAPRNTTVRIPLDYYRILGVPIKATEEQINQAYQDRLMQMPLRQYSDRAIASRQALIERAYKSLSVAEQRAEYDLKLLESSYPVLSESEELAVQDTPPMIGEAGLDIVNNEEQGEVSFNPTLEITSEQIMGALLILQELGEYEQILYLGEVYLNNIATNSSRETSEVQDDLPLQEDLLLTLALAYIELSREQWQQGNYENAALSSKMALDLLAEENIFPSVREEIETDLCRLRPYRILELFAQNPTNSIERARGFQLLKEMLQERQGIEGNGRDRSGLKCDQFLCFIQQLRNYLTAAEQQELFEEEAKRPSAVAAYITIYALIARGFAEKQADLIHYAQKLLQSLIISHDVYWEQAVCALLLGQTQIANEGLLLSKEKEKVDLVRQHSQNSPDLLPGLCFYGEQWLQKEVLSQFFELADRGVTLREYFADPQVQTYLERLTTLGATQSNSLPEQNNDSTQSKRQGFLSWGKKNRSKQPTANNYQAVGVADTSVEIPGDDAQTSIATLERNKNGRVPKNSHTSDSSSPQQVRLPPQKSVKNPDYRRKDSERKVVNGRPPRKNPSHRPRKRKNKSFLPILKGLILLIALVFGVGSLGFLLTRILLAPSVKQASQPETEYLAITLNQSLLELSSVAETIPQPKPEQEQGLTEKVAQQVIQQWLDSKSAAFGNEHQIEQLELILASPLLSQWRTRASQYKQTSEYRKYQHTIKVKAVKFDEKNPNQGSIEAEVREVAQHYRGQSFDPSQSYDDNLLVGYDLIRQGEKWLIKNIKVLKIL